MAPPPPPPSTSWVILSREVRACGDGGGLLLPEGADLSLELAAPPRVAKLAVSRRISPAKVDSSARRKSTFVIAIDPSGFSPGSCALRPWTRAAARASAPPTGKADDAERRAAHARGKAPSSTCIPAVDGARRRSRAASCSYSSKVGESSTCSRAPRLGKRSFQQMVEGSLSWCRTTFADLSLVERKAKVSSGLFDEEEEEEEGDFFYCVARECRAVVEEDHPNQAVGHETLRVKLVRGRGNYLVVIGDKPWSWFFGGMESIPVEKGKGKLVPLRPRSGRRCTACADVLVASESALFCTFQCRVRSGEAAGHRWAQNLLLEEFAVLCGRFDRVCGVFPAESFCGSCCGSHHSCAPGTAASKNSRFTTGRVVDSDGRTVVRHVSDPDGGRCRGICMICNGDVASADHACLRSLQLVAEEAAAFSNERHSRDAFCFDCAGGFSSVVCDHHRGHTWLHVCLHDGHHGVLLPEDIASSWILTGLDAVQYHQVIASSRSVDQGQPDAVSVSPGC
uniref:Uncharacterized protein n=1 Tax=Oryza punctata TaxID=4537 RepID=A0A0E0JG69_ORYPU